MLQVPKPYLSLSLLVNLTHRRWCIPILAEFAKRGDAKFVTLTHRLGCGRSALSASLKHLMELQLVTRNKGVGHPLRPEYLLTESGHIIASACCPLTEQIDAWNGHELAYRKWSLPLVMAVGPKPKRFNDLKKTLNPISPRALAMGLQHLEKGAWISRSVTPQYPPVAHYCLVGRGEKMLDTLGA